MLNEAIKLGDKLAIKKLDEKSEKEYVSKLLDMKEDGTISIAMPIEKSQIILLDIGNRYQITFYAGKGLYQCEAKVVQRYKTHSIYVAVMQVLTDTKKMQRREYYRLHCRVDLDFCILPESPFQKALEKIENSNTAYECSTLQLKVRAVELLKDTDAKAGTNLIEMKKGIITDISGGGIRFRAKCKIEPDAEFYLVFSLNQGLSYYRVFGSFVRADKVQDKIGIYDYRVMFSEINQQEREDIVRYILNEERRIRQKEKGFC